MDTRKRCDWAMADPLLLSYHDIEWGRPLHDDRKLFELLILETMQAGLSWQTVLRKRDAFRTAFADFDYREIMNFDDRKVASMLENPELIRNRMKIRSVIVNSIALSKLIEAEGSFDRYLSRFVPESHPVPERVEDIPARSTEGDTLSKDLKKRGFSFTGPVMCYSFMQAVGMVNDHISSCFVRREI